MPSSLLSFASTHIHTHIFFDHGLCILKKNSLIEPFALAHAICIIIFLLCGILTIKTRFGGFFSSYTSLISSSIAWLHQTTSFVLRFFFLIEWLENEKLTAFFINIALAYKSHMLMYTACSVQHANVILLPIYIYDAFA